MKTSIKFIILGLLILTSSGKLTATEYSFTSESQVALKTLLNGKAKAGDIIYLEDGIYSDFQMIFKGEGSESNPITLRARNNGKAIISGAVNLKIGGSWLIVQGLNFENAYPLKGDLIEFRSSTTSLAYNCRITECAVDNCNNTAYDKNNTSYTERWVMLYGKNNKVDHCYFANKDRNGVLMMVSLADLDSQKNKHIIEQNFFGYREVYAPGNGGEIIRLGDSGTSMYSSETIIRNNFFYQCDGEVEIVSIKSADNLISQNTFYESAGSVVCRHGKNNIIEANMFIGNNKANCGGVRLINAGHKVYNNYFQDLAGTKTRSALCIMKGIFENPDASTNTEIEPLNSYHRVRDAEVVHNTFVNCASVEIGTEGNYTYAGSYRPGEKILTTLKPENTIIANNIIYNPKVDAPWKNLSEDVVSDITFTNNLYLFKKDFIKSGFVKTNLNYEKQTDESAKGNYKWNTTTAVGSVGNFDYVTTDITARLRDIPKDAGAEQFQNLKYPFAAARPSACGTSWHSLQLGIKSDIEAVFAFFAEATPASLAMPDDKNSTLIYYSQASNSINILTEDSLKSVSIYSLSGSLIKEFLKPANNTINLEKSFVKGVYLVKIVTVNSEQKSVKLSLN